MTPEKIDKVHDIVLADRRMKMRQLSGTVCISIDRVHVTLHHEFCLKNPCAGWAPCLLTLEQKSSRIQTLAECLQLFKKNSAGFCEVFYQHTKGMFLNNYLKKGKTITGEYHASLLERAKTAIAEKRLGMHKKK